MRRLPRLISGFVEGATGREVGAENNTSAFERIKLQPRVLKDVGNRSTATRFLDEDYDVPFGVAPMGMCNLVHPGADRFLTNAARVHNLPLAVSTAASTSLEDLYQSAPGRVWFQLYVMPPLEHTLSLVRRAEECGYDTLVLTVDVPQVSRRIRDLQNGFSVDFKFGARQIYDFITHPAYSLRMLIAGRPAPLNFPNQGASFDRAASRALANWAFLGKLRDLWKGKLIVKGVTSTKDAKQIKQLGADAIYVSNHGGRQLDSVAAAIDILPLIREAVGPDYPLIMDSGLRGGEDILKAFARGADFVMFGRPIMFALGAEGEKGLESLLQSLRHDLSTAMAQIGVTSIEQLGATNLAEVDVAIGEQGHEG